MLIFLAVILVGAAYYFFVVQNVANMKAANAVELEEVQTQITVQSTIASMRSSMQHELDQMGDVENLPVIATYDNLRNELDELNAILGQATSFDMKMAQPTVEGETVRRTITLTFTTPNYDAAIALVEGLQNSKYRCEITDFSFNGKMLADGSIESVSGTLNVTYYETTADSTNLNGLVEQKTK